MQARIGWACIAALFAVNCWRAATRSIVEDEALTFILYLNRPWADTFTQYTANNHVLHTYLAKLAVDAFGSSEFVIRIPTLLGGLLYLLSSWRICRFAFGENWYSLAAFLALSLNPYVLDFLSLARGYALSLGFFLFALDRLLRGLQGGTLYGASIGFALSVSANLTILFPACALAMMTAVLLRRRLGDFVKQFVVPSVVVSAALLLGPLIHATRADYFVGAKSLGETVRGLVNSSIPREFERTRQFTANYFVPAVSIAGAVLAAMKARSGVPLDRTLLAAASAFWGAIALATLGWVRLGLLLPAGRTGLYLIPLFLIMTLALAAHLKPTRMLMACGLAVAGLIGTTLREIYPDWLYNAPIRHLALRIGEHRQDGLRVAASFPLFRSLDYYRVRYRYAWMRPIEDFGFKDGGDLYFVAPDDEAVIAERGLSVIERQAGVSVAKPR